MTSDSTTPSEPEKREEDVADAVVPPPPVFDDAAAAAVVPPPPVFDDNRADVVVPPPPSFDGPLTGSVPGAGDSASAPLRRRPLPPVAVPEPGPLAPEPDPAFVSPEVPSSGGYRGWTVAIFSFLVLLLAGAIALVIYLATSTTLNFPSFDSTSSDDRSESAATSPPVVDIDDLDGVGAVAGQPCSDFCGQVSTAVGARVVGADGDVEWRIDEPWVSTEIGQEGVQQRAVGTYSSSVGTLEFTVWSFDDDATAQLGFDAQIDDRGEPTLSDSVYADGRGHQNTYVDAAGMTIIWIVADDDGHPWVLQVAGPDDEAVDQFYLALPI